MRKVYKAFILGDFSIIYNLPLNWRNDSLSKDQVKAAWPK